MICNVADKNKLGTKAEDETLPLLHWLGEVSIENDLQEETTKLMFASNFLKMLFKL